MWFIDRLTSRQALNLSILIFLVIVFLGEWQILPYTDGIIVYPLENAFTSMATAKNLALHQVWAPSGETFVSATSSILYPLIQAACFMVFGTHIAIPLIINTIIAIILLIVIQKWLIRHTIKPFAQLLILLSVILFVPLPILVIIGMEHTLQILFSVLFVYTFSEKNKGMSWQVYGYAALLTATRYEGVFLVFVACLMLLSRRKWLRAGLLGLAGLLPVLIFGIISLSKDNFFLPNSVLSRSAFLPTNLDEAWAFLKTGIFERIFYSPASLGTVAVQRILIMIPLLYLLFRRQLRDSPAYRDILLLLLGAVLMHIIFANSILFYRYESYLVAAFLPVTGALFASTDIRTSWRESGMVRWMAVLALLILIFPLFWRSKKAFEDIPLACINVYQQGYQLAIFLKTNNNKDNVALYDMGTVSYLSEANSLDLMGIGNMELARARKEKYLTPDFLLYVIQKDKVKTVVVSEKEMHPWFFQHWTRVASWSIKGVVPPGNPDLTFFSVDKADVSDLRKRLQSFQPALPRGVKVDYF